MMYDIPPSHHGNNATTTIIRVLKQLGDAFYDLTGWRKIHPAGNHWIDRFAVSDNEMKLYIRVNLKALFIYLS